MASRAKARFARLIASAITRSHKPDDDTGPSNLLSRLRFASLDAGFVLGGLIATTLVAFAANRFFHFSTAAIWLYLPFVLLGTLRWGLVWGILIGLSSDLLVVIFLAAPLARDSDSYARLAASGLGMAVAALTVADLDRRRQAAERRGRVEAETLAELGRRISSSLKLDEVLRTAAESARRLVGADVISIALGHPGRSSQVVSVTGNRSDALSRLITPAAGGIASQIAAHGRAAQTRWDERSSGETPDSGVLEAMREEGIQTTLGVPIEDGASIVGMFWAHRRSRREFTAGEIALLERLAAQAGVAITNARVHAEEREARSEVEALLAATESLGVQAEPEAVLRTLIEQAALLLQAERAMYVVERDGERVIPTRLLHGQWYDDATKRTLSPDGISFQVWESGVPDRSNDLAGDPRAAQGSVEEFNLRSQLTAPLLGPAGETIGLIALNNSTRAEGFSERDQRLLVAICETGAAVLLRANETAARLEAQREAAWRKQEVEALLAAADELNSALEPEEVLLRVVGIAAELLAVGRVGIATNEGDHALRRYTLLDGVWHSEPQRLPLDGSMSGWVIRNARPYRSDAFALNPEAHPLANYNRVPERALGVPILGREGSVLGSLNLFDRRDGQPFTDGDQRLAEAITHHAAVALERATLMQHLRQSEEHLRHLAVTDSLTGLPNRILFLARLTEALDHLGRTGDGVAVLFLDLDGFKVVNDSLGHSSGDDLLRSVGEHLLVFQRASDLVARFGGDEFAVLLDHVEGPAEAMAVAERIIDALRRSSSEYQQGLFVNASVGVAFRGATEARCSPEELIREADIALYRAKAEGKGRAVCFTPEMSVQAVERLELQADLQRALERGELRVYHQPIVDLRTGAVLGTEALARWAHPRRGMLSPDTFIPVAEETGLILPLGEWVLEEACRQAQIWRTQANVDERFHVSVNVSVRQVEKPHFVDQVAATLERVGLSPSHLQLEITESALLAQVESTLGVLPALKKLGVQVALDDFGTGYSSLSYLQRLAVDTLKIDRSFIAGLRAGSTTAAIVQAVVILAHALGMEVTAEGVETAGHVKVLTELGCDFGQGYYFASPREAAELTAMLSQRCRRPRLPTQSRARAAAAVRRK